jgi:hypothetical protein
MYKTNKYDWTNFEEISLESDKLLFELQYTDPNNGYYDFATANFGGDPSKMKMPSAFTNVIDDDGQGPIKLSDAINHIADTYLGDGCFVTGWEIKPCDENGRQTNRETSDFVKAMTKNSKRIGDEKRAGKRNVDGTKVGSNVIKFPKKRAQ